LLALLALLTSYHYLSLSITQVPWVSRSLASACWSAAALRGGIHEPRQRHSISQHPENGLHMNNSHEYNVDVDDLYDL